MILLCRRQFAPLCACATLLQGIKFKVILTPLLLSKGLCSFQFLRNIEKHSNEKDLLAVTNHDQQTFSYHEIVQSAQKLAHFIKIRLPNRKIKAIINYNHPDVDYVITLLATWYLGACTVPLCVSHSSQELKYFIEDSQADLMVHSSQLSKEASLLKCEKIEIDHQKLTSIPVYQSSSINPMDNALILYTSGTTGLPKGVVHTFNTVTAMVESLSQTWSYCKNDNILHFLPLHHLHGVLNKLLCILSVGGHVEFMKSAAAKDIWNRLASDQQRVSIKPLSIFMAVPTIYARLLQLAENKNEIDENVLSDALKTIRRMRFMACGSAALPEPVLLSWKEMTGHTLLERFGMTEIGMGLSNPLFGNRSMGTVGKPLPFVSCRLVDENEQEITEHSVPGELRIKGATVFKEYLNKKKEYLDSFDDQNWFKTGDIAERTPDGCYKILGRNSTDIIKSGGYKLSALEIEREILASPLISEATVVGKDDLTYGQLVVAIVTLKDTVAHISIDDLRAFLKDRLASYKQPRQLHVVEYIPRNKLGKVNKKTILSELHIQ